MAHKSLVLTVLWPSSCIYNSSFDPAHVIRCFDPDFDYMGSAVEILSLLTRKAKLSWNPVDPIYAVGH